VVSGEFVNYIGSTPSFHQDSLLMYSEANNFNLAAKQRGELTLSNLPDPLNTSQFAPTADSTKINITFHFKSEDNRADKDYDVTKYAPLDFRNNDTLTTTYTLSNYYAY